MTTSRTILFLGALGLALGACAGGTTSDTSGTAGDGCVMVTYDGVKYCVVTRPIIETGFECPPDMSPASQGPSFAVCGPASGGGLDDADGSVVGALGGQGCYAPALDVLAVVDNSTSMADEQRALVANLATFAGQLQTLGASVHFGVTTTDLQCDPDNGYPASRGRFNVSPATSYPASARPHVPLVCSTDEDCVAALGGQPGDWSCWMEHLAECQTNPNGSVNTSCTLRCTEDATCQAQTGEPTAICQKVGADPKDWGCIVPPPAATCPPELQAGPRSWLETDELDQAACVASVGMYAPKCYQYEQGLGGAWAALDPAGPNAQQSAGFLRADADLVLVFVSDEDDCTVADGQTLDESQYDTCATLGDTTTGGPLVPVAELADRFRSLKGADRHVFVAAIDGDSLAADKAKLQSDRDAYLASKTAEPACHARTTICSGPLGLADYGARYFALARAFGDDGLTANLCAPDAFADLLSRLMVRITQAGTACQAVAGP